MISIALLLGIVAVSFGILYKVLGNAPVEPSAEQKRREGLWKQGYAFNTLKVYGSDYANMKKVSLEKKALSYDDLKNFKAVIFTQEHGAYRSGRVENILVEAGRISLTIIFPDALGDTVVEHYIVLNGESEIVLESTSQIYAIALSKGDQFKITQTLDLRGQNAV